MSKNEKEIIFIWCLPGYVLFQLTTLRQFKRERKLQHRVDMRDKVSFLNTKMPPHIVHSLQL